MKKKIGKSIGDASARVKFTRAAYFRALVAYGKFLLKEVEHLPDDAPLPPVLQKVADEISRMKGKKK